MTRGGFFSFCTSAASAAPLVWVLLATALRTTLCTDSPLSQSPLSESQSQSQSGNTATVSTCRTGEHMACYTADNLDFIRDEACIENLDKVLDRALSKCLENWSRDDSDNGVIIVSNVLQVIVRARTSSTTTRGDYGGKSFRGNRSLGLSNTGCRRCVRNPDCTLTNTCATRTPRKLLLTQAVSTLKNGRTATKGALVPNDADADDDADAKTESAFDRYDMEGAANCLDMVLTFEAQPSCPNVQVTNGVLEECT